MLPSPKRLNEADKLIVRWSVQSPWPQCVCVRSPRQPGSPRSCEPGSLLTPRRCVPLLRRLVMPLEEGQPSRPPSGLPRPPSGQQMYQGHSGQLHQAAAEQPPPPIAAAAAGAGAAGAAPPKGDKDKSSSRVRRTLVSGCKVSSGGAGDWGGRIHAVPTSH